MIELWGKNVVLSDGELTRRQDANRSYLMSLDRDKLLLNYRVADTELPEVVSVAKAHNIHPVLVCLKWAVQRGSIPIPFSVHAKNYEANLRAVTEDPLSASEMELLKQADRHCRLVKGQVFLWPGAKGWEDLWD